MLYYSEPNFSPKFVEVLDLSEDRIFMSERGTMDDMLSLKDEITLYIETRALSARALTDRLNQFIVITVCVLLQSSLYA